MPLFADYAAEVARRFGDRLASIATLNEPWCVATLGYETAQFAPGQTSRAVAAAGLAPSDDGPWRGDPGHARR